MISIDTYHKYICTYDKYGSTAVYFSHLYHELSQSFKSKHTEQFKVKISITAVS